MPNSILEKDIETRFPLFTVLKASAGSGKTHTLAKRYVQFLLSEKIPRNGLRNILAVTFSNNAAREMKERILQWLKDISLRDKGKTDELEAILSLRREEMAGKADELIDSILDNYSDLQIKTLDSFMATIFKSSAIDFGYHPDFEILMNNASLMEYAFNIYLRNVKNDTGEGDLLKHITSLVMENKSRNSSFVWEPTNTVFKEVTNLYRKLSSAGVNVKISDFSPEIREIKKEIIKQVAKIGNLIKNSNLQISKGSSYNSILGSVGKGEFPNLIGKGFKSSPVKKPGKKDSEGESAFKNIGEEWQKLKELVGKYTYFYACSYYNPYLKFYFAFRETLETIKKQEGKVFIEDINKKLSDYMDSQIVPDIYFRTGDTIFHYLIDEFQDTSPVQWVNLQPLIENSLSVGGSLFIVGDTKQSIYGFRDADYRIMKEFEESSPFPSASHSVKELTYNYRSRKKILDFNEKVFKEKLSNSEYSEAAQKSGLDSYIQQAISDDENTGYVEVHYCDKSDPLSEKEKIVRTIHELVQRGYGYGDIAVLTMKNESVILTSAWLYEAGIPFVSYSSLDVRKRKVALEIISLLNFLNSPPDDLVFTTFCIGQIFSETLKRQSDNEVSVDDLHAFLFNSRKKTPLYKSFQAVYPGLWEKFFEGLFKSVGYLPLYDLVSEIFRVFRVFEIFEEEEAAFVKILEVIKDFEDRGSNSLSDFLDYAAEETGQDKEWDINVPEGVDAVKVMTVHKSKGLGFPVVINLLYGERLNKKIDYFFGESDDQATLMKITKDIIKSSPEFTPLYEDYKTRERVNRLNSLYVGFTRAKEELYVIGVKGEKDKFPFELLPDEEFRPLPDKPVVKLMLKLRKAEEPEKVPLTYHHFQASQYPIYTGGMVLTDEKKRGELIHRVLSQMEYPDYEDETGLEEEISRIVCKVKGGPGKSKGTDEIVGVIKEFLLNDEVKKYFQRVPMRKIKNEQEFADSRGGLLRMDRVIIDKDSVTVMDFKSGKAETSHKKQLENYMKVLGEIYYGKTINGVIAYVDSIDLRIVAP